MRTLDQARFNASRIKLEIPVLIQPSMSDFDMVILGDEVDRLTAERDTLKATLNQIGIVAKGIAEAEGEGYRLDAAWVLGMVQLSTTNPISSSLTVQNAALSARVQALEKDSQAVAQAWMDLDELGPRHPMRPFREMKVRDALIDLTRLRSSTPALDLSKHDEVVRRDALEQAWERILLNVGYGYIHPIVKALKAAIFGIPPSTETPIQEPK